MTNNQLMGSLQKKCITRDVTVHGIWLISNLCGYPTPS
jgi:hypothetical protein